MKFLPHCITHKTDSTNKTEIIEDDTVCPAPELDPQFTESSNGTSQSGSEVRSTDIIWNEKDKADILGAYFIGYRYEARRTHGKGYHFLAYLKYQCPGRVVDLVESE